MKRVARTTIADWEATHESAEQRWKDGQAALQQGNFNGFLQMLYSRLFLTAVVTNSPAGASTTTTCGILEKSIHPVTII